MKFNYNVFYTLKRRMKQWIEKIVYWYILEVFIVKFINTS